MEMQYADGTITTENTRENTYMAAWTVSHTKKFWQIEFLSWKVCISISSKITTFHHQITTFHHSQNTVNICIITKTRVRVYVKDFLRQGFFTSRIFHVKDFSRQDFFEKEKMIVKKFWQIEFWVEKFVFPYPPKSPLFTTLYLQKFINVSPKIQKHNPEKSKLFPKILET